jgi:hypothetical protein
MKLTDTQIKIICTIIVIVMLILVFFKKVKPMLDMKSSLKKALDAYDATIVENCERIFRLESGNFTSGQFLGTYSPGMEPASPIYPYGWNSLKDFWDSNNPYKPIGIKTYTENGTGIRKQFIQFPTVEAGVFTVCEWLTIFENNPGRWFSTDVIGQANYNIKINGINATYTDEV